MWARPFAMGVVVFVVALLGIDARATYGARVTADEPQYLLSALSLTEDFDLDISDEIRAERFRDFHEVPLNPQTLELNDSGQRLSPHDPLLPLLLAVPMGLWGWVGAKAALALLAALTASATLWVAVQRFDAPLPTASWIVGGFFVAPPLVSYGTQVYPATPAALCVVAGLAAVTAPRLSWRWALVALCATVALPWLSVKYVPLAAFVAVAWLWRRVRSNQRTQATLEAAALALAGVVYLVVHQRIYGGWTVYAAGDHFVDGEWLVVGQDANYWGRSRRLIGLLVDRGFGLAAWNPAYLLTPMALGAVARVRPPRLSLPLLTLFGVGWAVATWVALTMHGWWWPGRQVVPVMPLVAIAVAVWVGPRVRFAAVVVGACLMGTLNWLWLVVEASTGRRTLIFDFQDTASPWYRIWQHAFPNHRPFATTDQIGTWVWAGVLTVGVTLVLRQALKR